MVSGIQCKRRVAKYGVVSSAGMQDVHSQRLCTKSNMPTVQYRERSDRMAHSTNQPSKFRRNVECAIAALRSRYCTERSTLTKIRVFVQSHSQLAIIDRELVTASISAVAADNLCDGHRGAWIDPRFQR